MTTVQLAIHNTEYAQSLRNLLLRDGTHRVMLVEKPDLKVQGVVVIEAGSFKDLLLPGVAAERFVVITRKGEEQLTRIWEAGVRHVVFEEDSPNTAQLAVIAAELRMPKAGEPFSKETAASRMPVPPLRDQKSRTVRRDVSVLDSRPQCSHCCFIQNPIRIF